MRLLLLLLSLAGAAFGFSVSEEVKALAADNGVARREFAARSLWTRAYDSDDQGEAIVGAFYYDLH